MVAKSIANILLFIHKPTDNAGEQEISFPANKQRRQLWNSNVDRFRWI